MLFMSKCYSSTLKEFRCYFFVEIHSSVYHVHRKKASVGFLLHPESAVNRIYGKKDEVERKGKTEGTRQD